MRKIREVLRLKFDVGLSVRKTAARLSIGHSSAGDYLCRFAASGLQWPLDISDAEFNRRLFPPPRSAGAHRPAPDARLGVGTRRVAPSRRNPGAALAGISTRSTAGLPVQLVLRALPPPDGARQP